VLRPPTILRFLVVWGLSSALLVGQQASPEPADGNEEQSVSENQPTPAADEPEAASQRTELNLLGQVDAASGEGQRNENVSLTLIDNNVLKELNSRIGTTANPITEFSADRKYFGKEFGGSPSGPLHVGSSSSNGVHGSLNWTHGNSIFKARSFFQVGKVQPSRSNDYGATVTTPLWGGGFLTLSGGQRKLRGQVNGNILVPSPDERTPTTTDPETLAIVQSILAAYPTELPNRTDINERALNTNAPQNIDDHRASSTYDQGLGDKDRLVFRYNLTLQNVDAFQMLAGQNPDTRTRNHDARTTWSRVWGPSTTTDFSIGFDRVNTVLTPDESSIGPVIFFNRAWDFLGPSPTVPLDRAQNTFRYAGRLQRTSGNHTLNMGFDVARRQVNGFEDNNHRGTFSFRNDFGRTFVENVLAGTPSNYLLAVGSSHRGFRAWAPSLYFGDVWRASQRLTMNFGLRYEVSPTPAEVNNLSEIPYDCDCNNLAPTFGFAYRLNDNWGVVRASYGIHYGELFSPTYMQTRFNPPGVTILNVNTDNLVNPLEGFSEGGLDPNPRSDFILIDRELATPYSHQYNFTWELTPFDEWTVELGYVGSRSHKLLSAWLVNRGGTIEGVESTTSNVNQRRADDRYTDVSHVLNGSRAFYDAAKITLRVPRWAGLNIDASYWWSKAIDLGGNYTNTGAGRDARLTRSPSEFNVHQTMKGLSDFDQPHALLVNTTYSTPTAMTGNRVVDRVFGSWLFAGVALLKTGSPFSLRSGADGPGLGNLDGVSSDRPNVLDPSVLGAKVDHPDTSQASLPSSAFGFQTPDQLAGTVGRNTFRKDGVWNVNMSLSRRFPVKGDTSVELRAESLNLLNHAQFAEPGRSLRESNFGQITNTLNDGRTFQFTLKLDF
jgi:hypothetical protein